MTLILLAGVVLILGLGLLLAALLLDIQPPTTTPRRVLRRRSAPLISHERDLARTLGMATMTLFGIRLVVVSLAGYLWVLTQLPVLALLVVMLGTFGIPYALDGFAGRRRLRLARGMESTFHDIANRLERGSESADGVLKSIAANPRPEVADLLAPLRTAGSVDVAFAKAAAMSGSAMVERAYLLFAACRTRDNTAMVKLLREVQVPQLRAEIREAEEALRIQSGQRATVTIMGAVVFAAVAILNGQAPVHAFYASATGQLMLCLVTAIFTGSMTVMTMLTQPSPPARWNVERASQELERIRG